MKRTLLQFALAGLFTALALPAFAADKEVTVTGDGKCAKCALKETDKCQNAIQTQENGKTTTYYLAARSRRRAARRCSPPPRLSWSNSLRPPSRTIQARCRHWRGLFGYSLEFPPVPCVYNAMKRILCAVSLAASLGFAQAQVLTCGPCPAYYQAAMAYMTPVIYQAAAVYQGPVAYYGPVYYNTAPAGYDWCEAEYEPLSTVVVIGADRAYSYSNRGYLGSSVTYIGSQSYGRSFHHGRNFTHGGRSHGQSDGRGRASGRRR
jgi:hypothetical protein